MSELQNPTPSAQAEAPKPSAVFSDGSNPKLNAKRIVRFLLKGTVPSPTLNTMLDIQMNTEDQLHGLNVEVEEDGNRLIVRNADIKDAVDLLFDSGIFMDVVRFVLATITPRPAPRPARKSATALPEESPSPPRDRAAFRPAIDEPTMDGVLERLAGYRNELENCLDASTPILRVNRPTNAKAIITELESIIKFLKE